MEPQTQILTPSRTERRNGQELHELILSLNNRFALGIPNPLIYSPSKTGGRQQQHPDQQYDGYLDTSSRSLQWSCYYGIQRLYYNRTVDLDAILSSFEEWVIATTQDWSYAYASQETSQDTYDDYDNDNDVYGDGYGSTSIAKDVLEDRLNYLMKLIDDEIYLLDGGSYFTERYDRATTLDHDGNYNDNNRDKTLALPLRNNASSYGIPTSLHLSVPKNGKENNGDVHDNGNFHTAPNSPVKDGCAFRTGYATCPWDGDRQIPTTDMSDKSSSDLIQSHPASKDPSIDAVKDVSRDSVSTITTSSITGLGSARLDPFDMLTTDVAESTDPQSVFDDSAQGDKESNYKNEGRGGWNNRGENISVVEELLQSGPFSIDHPFERSVPLRYRYELERVGRSWAVPLSCILTPTCAPPKTYEEFWTGVEHHTQRGTNVLPEKPARRAWDAAVGDFRAGRLSEIVDLSGDLEWCSESERGILKLKLNPLKIERSCRFYRRFGSDRFLSLTLPAPSRAPRHLRFRNSQPTSLREDIATWLTQHKHQLLGRWWRPFYVEEVRAKRSDKSATPRLKVEFFAVDGVDFDHDSYVGMPPAVAPPKQESNRHTPMTLEALINWHMRLDANREQPSCKLFQRIQLGLSRTFATVRLKRRQLLHLSDVPGRPVMNDGCALMSKGMANKICYCLGITGNTPSCFQGRIAGAKGLWMVDSWQESPVGGEIGESGEWIQISDSQLKIKPHPQQVPDEEPIDDEQLTFEIVNWSKPLRSADLNIQLLGILDNGGPVKDRIAELTRLGIQALYRDFAAVLESNSGILCRSLVQKLRPAIEVTSAKTTKGRRLDQWMIDDAECIIRLSEAGFQPASFYPLRRRLGNYLRKLLDRNVNDLHIGVPLSTYAYCIADPYGVLEEHEVHFGFSVLWRDPYGNFEDNLIDGMDVLVGRVPAHLPSDIQRRRAVWKPELRHFKDVIVFPTRGNIPLAMMLSGGDYDGDTPWICWDQNIVASFKNSELPQSTLPMEHFGLTDNSVPMHEISSMDEFLFSTFLFNLSLSNLGRCTVEHEKIAYDEAINSNGAKDLACLLSYLVDGRKAGLHLSEQAWRQYRKTISPRERQVPAYRNPERRHKETNITDYLKFVVAENEKWVVLGQLEQSFPEAKVTYTRDEDLIRPWNEVKQIAETDKLTGGMLHMVLTKIEEQIDRLKTKWDSRLPLDRKPFGPIAHETINDMHNLDVPSTYTHKNHHYHIDHPILHTWRTSPNEWHKVLASCTYKKYQLSGFVMHVFGETLCRIKSSTLPSRTVTNDILACYKIGAKLAQQATARDLPRQVGLEGENNAFIYDDYDRLFEEGASADTAEYQGQDAIEMLVLGEL